MSYGISFIFLLLFCRCMKNIIWMKCSIVLRNPLWVLDLLWQVKIPDTVTSNQQNDRFFNRKNLKRKITKGHHLSVFADISNISQTIPDHDSLDLEHWSRSKAPLFGVVVETMSVITHMLECISKMECSIHNETHKWCIW